MCSDYMCDGNNRNNIDSNSQLHAWIVLDTVFHRMNASALFKQIPRANYRLLLLSFQVLPIIRDVSY